MPQLVSLGGRCVLLILTSTRNASSRPRWQLSSFHLRSRTPTSPVPSRCLLLAETIAAQSSRIKARAIEAAKRNQKVESSSNKHIDVELSSFDVEGKVEPAKATAPATNNPDPSVSGPSADKMSKDEPASGGSAGEGKRPTSHVTAVAVCVAGAVMSSMLQFSFVYGEEYLYAWSFCIPCRGRQ